MPQIVQNQENDLKIADSLKHRRGSETNNNFDVCKIDLLRIFKSNEILWKDHTKIVSTLAIDHTESRVFTSSYGYSICMYDSQETSIFMCPTILITIEILLQTELLDNAVDEIQHRAIIVNTDQESNLGYNNSTSLAQDKEIGFQFDFPLRRYSTIVTDEAHERSLNTLILIGMLSQIIPLRQSLYEDQQRKIQCGEIVSPKNIANLLKLVLMSEALRIDDSVSSRKIFLVSPPVAKVPNKFEQFPWEPFFSNSSILEANQDRWTFFVLEVSHGATGGVFMDFWLSSMVVVATLIYMVAVDENTKVAIYIGVAIITALIATSGPTRTINIVLIAVKREYGEFKVLVRIQKCRRTSTLVTIRRRKWKGYDDYGLRIAMTNGLANHFFDQKKNNRNSLN
eukprot:Gb_10541 [translate_table: standard]